MQLESLVLRGRRGHEQDTAGMLEHRRQRIEIALCARVPQLGARPQNGVARRRKALAEGQRAAS